MNKILFAGIGLLVVLIAAALIGPSFVNWNAYKSDIGRLVKDATGRDLTIAGNIDIDVLPMPALIANDVRLANLAGATAPDMVRLTSMQVRVALLPLLGGTVRVQSVRLIEPVIEIEVFADGSNNLNTPVATRRDSATGDRPAGVGRATETATPDLSLDSFAIANGTLIYRDRRQGRIERVEAIDAEIAAGSLNGPFKAKGDLLLHGLPLGFEVAVGEIVHDRAVTVNATVQSRPSAAKFTLNGGLTGLGDASKLSGKLHLEGSNLAALVQSITGAAEVPGLLAQSFKADGEIAAGAERTEINGLAFQFGDTQGTAVATLQPGDATAVSAAVSMGRIDLDAWLARPPFRATAAKSEARPTRVEPQGNPASIDIGRAPARPTEPTAAQPFAIPETLIGILDIHIDAINYRGKPIRDLRASADLGGGRLDINQLSAQLPGSSEASLAGALTFVQGKPRFAGDATATVNDLRGVLDWLGTPLPAVPGDRLRRTTAKSKIAYSADEIQLSGIDLQVDGSRIAGALTVALRDRPAFGANLSIDKLNLDSYLPAAEGETAAASPGRTASPVAGTPGGGPAGGPATGLAVLQGFDTNLRARIDSLTYQRTAIRDVALDLTLVQGEMQIRQASVADLAGSSIGLSGGVNGFATTPIAKGLRVDLKSPDTGRLFRMLGVTPPLPPEQLGTVGFSGLFDGPLLSPTVDATLAAAGGDFALKGKIAALSADTTVDGRVSARHPDLARLLRLFAADYRPAGPLGAVALSAQVTGGPAKVALSAIDGNIGTTAIKGEATFDSSGAKPRLTAKLTTGEVIVDRFLPAPRAARLDPAGGPATIVPVVWPGLPNARLPSAVVPAAGEPWSREPLSLAALQALDADLTLNSTVLVYQGYRLEQADIAATLNGGNLRTERLLGKLFGGAFHGGVALESAGVPRLTSNFNLQGGNLAQLLATTGSADKATGTINAELAVAGSGTSTAAIVSTLAGNGRFALTGVDTTQTSRGSPLAGLFELLTGLNRFGGVLTGGKSDGRADLTGTFTVAKGMARSEDIKLVSALGNGTAKGEVDLPNWQIDVQGQLDLKQNLVAAYLTRNTSKVPTTVPFQIKGPLDKPNVRIETAGLGGQPLPIPNSVIDKLNERNPAAGKILQQVLPELGTGEPTPAPQAQPQSQTQQQPAQQQPKKPEDLIRGLLKGFGR